MRCFEITIVPTLLFGPEHCAQIKKHQQRIETIEMTFLQVDTQLSN